ncbi:MAG: D-hexose-6-phosphate mutarotase [Ornithinimicrobium sp.]
MPAFEPRILALGGDELLAYDHGAHVTRWTHQAVPVVWVSDQARYEAGVAVRGGIPVCWPWFAAGPDGDRQPSHGLVRTRAWHSLEPEADALSWRLTHEDLDAEARATFDAEFACTLTARLEPGTLHVSLEVANRGAEDMTYEVALHTYLHVADVRAVSIAGLDGVGYYDKVHQREDTQSGDLRIDEAQDRIYHASGPVQVADPGLQRELHVTSTGASDTVIWNPGPDGAAQMKDFGDQEWTQVVCVETACVGSSAVHLRPGASHLTTSRIEVRT